MAPPDTSALGRYRRFAWAFLAYTLGVILWGAFVRASLSGDGCGDHWPLCNGEVLPTDPTRKTLIELTHRITSGLALIGALVLYLWSRRRLAPGHVGRRAAGWSLFFMITEGLVGAGLVLLEMVAQNPSIARGYWMGAHLVNTFLLLLALACAAFLAREPSRPVVPRGAPGAALGVTLLALVLVGVTGAIAALGDTLFPARSLAEGLAQDASSEAHVFVQLRVYHPIVALGAAALTFFTAGYCASRSTAPAVRRGAAFVAVVLVAQVALGFLNVALLAPIWLQLVHLLVADLLWIGVVGLTLLVAAEPRGAADAAGAAAAPTRPRPEARPG